MLNNTVLMSKRTLMSRKLSGTGGANTMPQKAPSFGKGLAVVCYFCD